LKLLGQNVAGILFEQHERFFESVMGQGRMSKAREEMRSERAMKMIAAFMRQCFEHWIGAEDPANLVSRGGK